MNHIFCPDNFLGFVLFFRCLCGNNEAEGTCFLQGPRTESVHYQPATRVETCCCFLKMRGEHMEGLWTPTELAHPLSPPASCSLMSCGQRCSLSVSRQTLDVWWGFPSAPSPLTSDISMLSKKKETCVVSSIYGHFSPWQASLHG